MPRPHVRQAKLSERGREREREMDPLLLYARRSFSIRFYFTTSVVVVIPLTDARLTDWLSVEGSTNEV